MRKGKNHTELGFMFEMQFPHRADITPEAWCPETMSLAAHQIKFGCLEWDLLSGEQLLPPLTAGTDKPSDLTFVEKISSVALK